MTYSTIMTCLCIAYVFIYAGMIIHDLFLVKEAESLIPKVEEEEIDISDELLAFQPIEIAKDTTKWMDQPLPKSSPTGQTRMTGAIEIGTLVPMMDDLSRLGKDSPLGGMIKDWAEHGMAA